MLEWVAISFSRGAKVLVSIICWLAFLALPYIPESIPGSPASRLVGRFGNGKRWYIKQGQEKPGYFSLSFILGGRSGVLSPFLGSLPWAALLWFWVLQASPSLWALGTHSLFLLLQAQEEKSFMNRLISRLPQTPLFAFQLSLVNQFPLFEILRVVSVFQTWPQPIEASSLPSRIVLESPVHILMVRIPCFWLLGTPALSCQQSEVTPHNQLGQTCAPVTVTVMCVCQNPVLCLKGVA